MNQKLEITTLKSELAADAGDVKALESLAKEIEAVKPVSRQIKTATDAGEEVGR